jgi:hypothetical protein
MRCVLVIVALHYVTDREMRVKKILEGCTNEKVRISGLINLFLLCNDEVGMTQSQLIIEALNF